MNKEEKEKIEFCINQSSQIEHPTPFPVLRTLKGGTDFFND